LELGANEAYEEAFVHPVMFSHTHPERVGIIGRRKSTALKEVLKHNSVSEVVMFIDEDDNDESVTLSSTKNNNYDNTSPDSFNCSDLMDIATVCDDDKRVELVKGDVSSWFVDDSIYSEQEPFDVLLMDVL
jgi:spermidine synthase